MKKYLIVVVMAVTLFLPYISARGEEDKTSDSPSANGVTLPQPSGKQVWLYVRSIDNYCILEQLSQSQQEEACRTEAYDTLTKWISKELTVTASLTCPYTGADKCRQCQNACYSSSPPIPRPPYSRSTCVSWCIDKCS